MRDLDCFLYCGRVNCAPSSPARALTLYDEIHWLADL